ncbi:CDP-glycerol glycerophosphotransferase family protein [Rathayibacter sp. KR2-224]|uniref:CDP-glycerol glycerophosphotransferase family protein n=1 Tax=Rathayibacter sp. KR2-224 TaxID=3400913 RepID=UPI003C0202F4
MKSPLARIRRQARKLRRAAQYDRHAFWRKQPIRPGTVLYESFSGNGALCNPEAIFRGLIADPEFADFRHVWAIAGRNAAPELMREFADDERVSFVTYRSSAYYKALATSQYLVSNATFPAEFSKRAGQVYLNTWHGTPLKQMGFDMPGGALDSANTLRNFLAADFLLAANEFMAERMYEDAYRLRNIYTGRIITEGYPRIDRQRLDGQAAAHLRAALERSGAELGDRSIVLYAPTWHGETFGRPEDDVDQLIADVRAMQRELGPRYVVLLKTHQIVHSFAASRPELRSILAPNSLPTNAILGVCDGLVTDYSSIFFDYLATGKPIVFYTPDAPAYAETRGTYFAPDELPGPVVDDAALAGSTMHALLGGEPLTPKYADWQRRFASKEDGNATGRVIDVVFRGLTDGLDVRPAATDGRRRLLLYLGGMRSNGITTAAMNLLADIDHDRYDVTVLMSYSRRGWHRANQALIPPEVRQIFRVGGMNGSKLSHVRRKWDERRGDVLQHEDPLRHKSLWDDEWTRVFGDARFDWVADFSGYGPFWSTLLLHSPDAPRAIWLHNEMAADRQREVNGKKRMLRSLGHVFALYHSYDRLVSVSPRLTELNRRELAEYAPPEHFVTVRNLPNVERVLAGMKQPLAELEGHPVDPETEEVLVPDWVQQLERHDARWFVTVGRLSPEKNHARLIRAFAHVHDRHPDARLLIVGGGPLRDQLQDLIDDSGLGNVVTLTGAYQNPFAILAAADCFVLSSVYEGQPMVLLEAAVCRLPIVSTAFASVHDALPSGAIHVVGQSDASLADGMMAFWAGDVPPSSLDADAYRAEVAEEFTAVVEAAHEDAR